MTRLVAILAVLVSLLASAPAFAQDGAFSRAAQAKMADPQKLSRMAARGDRINVIVMLQLPASAAGADASTERGMASLKTSVRTLQDQVLGSVLANTQRVANERATPQRISRFSGIPGFAASLTTAEIEALAANASVVSIGENAEAQRFLDTARPQIGMPAAYAAGAVGAGTVVAIIDDGAQITHPFLAGKAVDGGCFLVANTASTYNCPDGTRQQTGSASAGVNANSTMQHGTHVAGIAVGKRAPGGAGPESGISKEAQFMPLNVFGNSATTFFSDVTLALEYVRDRKDAGVNLVSVNMSLGGGRFEYGCDASYPSLAAVIDQLVTRNVATVIATGNNAFTDSISAPACISSAIAVGASSVAQDQIACYSNIGRQSNILLAPGTQSQTNGTDPPTCSRTGILSSVPVDSFANFNGTSMATPMVAGAWAALRSCAPTATVEQVKNALQSTGTTLTDSRTTFNGYPFGWLSKPRIRVDMAAQQLGCGGPAEKSVITAPVESATLSDGTTFTYTWGRGVTSRVLYLGTEFGASNIFRSGLSGTSVTVPKIPTGTVHATLWSQMMDGSWQFNTYIYTSVGNGSAEIKSPVNGATISDVATFTYTAGASNVTSRVLYVGTWAGGGDVFKSGVSGTSVTVSNIPQGTIYVTLWSLVAGTWKYNTYTYTGQGDGAAIISFPTSNSTIRAVETFAYSTGINVSMKVLYVGTSFGASNIFNGVVSGGMVTVPNIPAGQIHVTLWSLIGGTWKYKTYTYTGSGAGGTSKATIISPANNSTLGPIATFVYWDGIGVTLKVLYVGTSFGASNVFSGTLTGNFVSVPNIPVGTIHVTLWSLIGGNWEYSAYTYTRPAGS